MPDREKDEHIGCVLPRSERIALDSWASRNDLSRSQAIRRAIRLLLAHGHLTRRVGASLHRNSSSRSNTKRRHLGGGGNIEVGVMPASTLPSILTSRTNHKESNCNA